MSTIKNLRITRIVRYWLDLLLLLLLALFLMLALWLLVSPFVMAGGASEADVSVPVALGSSPIFPVVPVEIDVHPGESLTSAYLVGARGELRFKTSNWGLQFIANIIYLIAAIVVMYIIYLLRAMLREATQEGPFGTENVKRMRTIGVLFLLIGILGPILEYVTVRLILAWIASADLVLSAPISINPTILLTGLLVLILAHIWTYGADIEREQALTI